MVNRFLIIIDYQSSFESTKICLWINLIEALAAAWDKLCRMKKRCSLHQIYVLSKEPKTSLQTPCLVALTLFCKNLAYNISQLWKKNQKTNSYKSFFKRTLHLERYWSRTLVSRLFDISAEGVRILNPEILRRTVFTTLYTDVIRRPSRDPCDYIRMEDDVCIPTMVTT